VGDERTVVESQAPLATEAPATNDEEEPGRNLTVGQIAAKAGPGVVLVEAEVGETTSNPFGFPDQEEGRASGSGFVLNKQGYVATNAHVVDKARNVRVTFGESNTPVPAKLVGGDLSTDLAVVKVDPSKAKLTPIPLGDSSKARVGDPVVAIGNPFGYDHTVTTGIVSALGREIRAPNDFSISRAIQTDAAINPGNSGGPLIDGQGRVLGINSQIATSGGVRANTGVGFAVPVNLAKQVLPQLIKTGEVKHAYIGVTTTRVPPELVKDLNLPRDNGALVQDVQPGSPAEKAGLRAGKTQTGAGVVAGGDLIVGVDGRTVQEPEDIAAAIADNQPGDKVRVDFYRGKTKKSVTVTLGDRPDRAPSALPGSGP
jgi:S1-C subfamily serine protease